MTPLLAALTLSSALWQAGNFSPAKAHAQAAHRLLLVDFFTTWCSTCHDMDGKVYAQQKVQEFLAARFVALRLDAEAGEGEALAKRYHVVGYPTLLVIDPDSDEEIDRLMGFVESSELMTRLTEFGHGERTLAALEFEVALRHGLRGDRRAVAELEQVAEHDKKNGARALHTLGKYYYVRGEKNWSEGEKVLRDLIARFPGSPEAKEAPLQIALCQHGRGDDGAAQATLDGYIAAAPRDLEHYSSYAWAAYKNDIVRAHAVEVAKRGLAIDPKHDGLWDTLAELYNRAGDKRAAQAAERRAIALKPDCVYYRAQLKRFGGK